ncbi:thermonuclease family protein [Methylomonas sp. UP202]|uniref:thermonuclease family protein n=1 Tax=Methylomonas sp. UP202 TaxID=3040943 RepID=UPI00247842AE|nr:thermonuclease family protein [Methylomonas sp. UP202]WGS88681.1 thermonuclease family protein [Methylomonas sp. UP202]
MSSYRWNVRLIPLLTLLAFAGVGHAETLSGQVVGVHDGDTLTLLTATAQTVKVRLANIDAPESDQAYGQVAKLGLANAVLGRAITVDATQRDFYGRVVGQVSYQGRDINLEQVANGLAWVYRQFTDDPVYLQAEQAASQAKIGLWQDPAPVAPWLFRHH